MYEHDSRQIAFHDEPFLFGGFPMNSDNRLVKLSGLIPWSRVEEAYRKIFRGNRGARAKTEFGAKLTVSVVEGYAEVTTLSWDAYNESQDLVKAAKAYKMQYGHYPRRILADKIFRT